jgi:hypothetical protein
VTLVVQDQNGNAIDRVDGRLPMGLSVSTAESRLQELFELVSANADRQEELVRTLATEFRTPD